MNELYFSASESMTKKRADCILKHSQLVKLAENHLMTTSAGNAGSIKTYLELDRACKGTKFVPTDVLKAVQFRQVESGILPCMTIVFSKPKQNKLEIKRIQGQLKFDYDSRSDVLYAFIDKPRPAISQEQTQKNSRGVLIRIDVRNGKDIVGFTVIDFKRRIRDGYLKRIPYFEDVPINLIAELIKDEKCAHIKRKG